MEKLFSRKIILCIIRLLTLNNNVKFDRKNDINLFYRIDAKSDFLNFGRHVIVEFGVIVRTYGGRIDVGDFTTIGPYSVIYAGGNIIIGSAVRIGPRVSMFSSNHIYEDMSRLIKDQGMRCKSIIVEDDVWIGPGSIILDGVVIAKGAVIAAGSVVTSSVESYTVVAGVPARIIGRRGQ